MKTTYLLLFFTALAFASCKDEEPIEPEPTDFKLTRGSWVNDYRSAWVYTFNDDSTFIKDSAGVRSGGVWTMQQDNDGSVLNLSIYLPDDPATTLRLTDSSVSTFKCLVLFRNNKIIKASDSVMMNWTRVK
jgi:hypothetical protein